MVLFYAKQVNLRACLRSRKSLLLRAQFSCVRFAERISIVIREIGESSNNTDRLPSSRPNQTRNGHLWRLGIDPKEYGTSSNKEIGESSANADQSPHSEIEMVCLDNLRGLRTDPKAGDPSSKTLGDPPDEIKRKIVFETLEHNFLIKKSIQKGILMP